MEQTMKKGTGMLQILKALLAAYIVTGILLLILTLMLYQFDWDEQKVTAGIIVIYVLATFLGGFIIGKIKTMRKFFWGLLVGSLYFILLFLVSFCVYQNFESNGVNWLTTFLLCAGGGMLGGMLS